jgi:hypothetical protein
MTHISGINVRYIKESVIYLNVGQLKAYLPTISLTFETTDDRCQISPELFAETMFNDERLD